jgi:branched-chain amino acid transport system substrate-binding protein
MIYRSAAFALALCATAAPAIADVTIGLAGPITGSNAAIGAQLRAGAEAAIADINRAGGVLGEKLVLDVQDDRCDQYMALPVARHFVAAQVPVVLGHYCSADTLPASSIYADAGIIQLAFSTADRITQQGFDGLFRIVPNDATQARALADYIARHYPHQRLALIGERSFYAEGMVGDLRAQLKGRQLVDVVLDRSVDAGQTAFGSLVDEVVSQHANVVVYVGYAPELGELMRQARAVGVKVPFVSTSHMSNHRIWDIAGEAAEGMAFTFLPDANQLPAAQDVVARLAAKGQTADGFTLYAYAAVQLSAGAILQAADLHHDRAVHPDYIAEQLQYTGIPTVLGTVSFDEFGERIDGTWQIHEWHNGRFLSAPGEG